MRLLRKHSQKEKKASIGKYKTEPGSNQGNFDFSKHNREKNEIERKKAKNNRENVGFLFILAKKGTFCVSALTTRLGAVRTTTGKAS